MTYTEATELLLEQGSFDIYQGSYNNTFYIKNIHDISNIAYKKVQGFGKDYLVINALKIFGKIREEGSYIKLGEAKIVIGKSFFKCNISQINGRDRNNYGVIAITTLESASGVIKFDSIESRFELMDFGEENGS